MKKSVVRLGVLTALAGMPAMALAGSDTLKAIKTDLAPTIDGMTESLWERATPLIVELDELPYEPDNGYEGMQETEVSIQALYDDEYLYLRLHWADSTRSLGRFPWIKQDDGSWKRMLNKDHTGHENTYYEDKAALFWNINSAGFAKKGCDKSCHLPEDGLLDGVKDSSAGRHYTAEAGETIDMWHWKSARTNPNGQMDDQYMDAGRSEYKSWGRHSDDKSGGGYYYNLEKGRDTPVWMNGQAGSDALYWIPERDKVPFEDNFKPGDIVAGHVTGPILGARADITAKGVWHEGGWLEDDGWTLEIKRKLVTRHENSLEQDVQFDDLTKAYHFGVTVFDNTQINHLHHTQSHTLVFEQ